ncbi:MAG TPA: hypothetical protein VM364_11475 [Vicinamibacterales bacterium]|nr:hypothetical protein [Vicinamibacterales bacterium]
MRYQRIFALGVAVATATTLACSQAAPAPTSPAAGTPPASDAAADGSTLKVTAPTIVSPTGGIEVQDLDPDLVINNSTPKFVSSLPLSYVFEVIDKDNKVVYKSNPVPAGANGRTSHETGIYLTSDDRYTWRAYAVYQNQRGPTSTTAQFKVFNKFGVSCSHLRTEFEIVACRRAQYGFMNSTQRLEFVTRIAYDLNRGGFEHRPYGILVKTEGHNCFGYSCDIICSGQGSGQRQWDVLTDEDGLQGPKWDRLGTIAVRPCEFITQ